MSEFNRKLQNKIRGIMKDLKVDDLLLDIPKTLEDLDELKDWIDDEEGTDLEDILSDFDDPDIFKCLLDRMPKNVRLVEIPDINTESEIDEYLDNLKLNNTLITVYKN